VQVPGTALFGSALRRDRRMGPPGFRYGPEERDQGAAQRGPHSSPGLPPFGQAIASAGLVS
jgi:hypothetical protein